VAEEEEPRISKETRAAESLRAREGRTDAMVTCADSSQETAKGAKEVLFKFRDSTPLHRDPGPSGSAPP
jgi:hypothetical protein